MIGKDMLPLSEIQRREMFLRFAIKDSGEQGIPEDKVYKILDSFYSGAGAGMAIAAKIVDDICGIDICGILQIKSKGGGG